MDLSKLGLTREDYITALYLADRFFSIRNQRQSKDMAEWDGEQSAYGIIICISACVLTIMLYMSLFGGRMDYTAIRWHMINCSVWGLVHLGHYASFAEKAPFPQWIQVIEWRRQKERVECFTRSVFPAGMFFVMIERMLLTCAPSLADKRIFNSIFAFLLIPFLNAVMVFCFFAQYMDYVWYYNPIEMFNIVTYVLFLLLFVVYFVFCLFGSCCCCCVLFSKKRGRKTPATFVDMWLLLIYALIPLVMYGPSFGLTTVSFVTKNLMTYILQSEFFQKIMSGGGGDDDDKGGFLSGLMPDISTLMNIMAKALSALPWFLLVFPVVQVILAILCVRTYREQFFFLLTCGRCYNHRYKEDNDSVQKNWTIGGVQPIPIFASADAAPVKMDCGPPPV
ncbi:unnamed protein product [Auanema sp. JU1783]|nr:unnamed protein product [Auanema sp. JU1783]